jgi:hypothetical protein
LKTDEIDSRVWGTSLVDKTGTPTNNQLAVWTDSNTVEGEGSLQFDSSVDELSLSGRLSHATANIGKSTPVGTGTHLVYRISGLTSAQRGLVYQYAVWNGTSAMRSGFVLVTRDGAGNVTVADSSTADLNGSTTGIKLQASDNGSGTLDLNAVVTSGTWTVIVAATIIG